MTIDWTPLEQAIATCDRFLVTSHIRPDGDALGSEVGVAGLLKQRGKDVRIVNASRTPPRYAYLDPNNSLFEHLGTTVQPADLADRQAVIICDLSSWGQLGDMADIVRNFKGTRIVIDHHVSQDDLGAAMLKDTTAESCCTLVLRAAQALKATITPEMANALITGIAMDTGWYHHPSTKPQTMRDSATLIESGAQIHDIYRQVFEQNTAGRLKMFGEALARLKTDMNGRVAYTYVTLDDFKNTGAIPAETEDLVDFTVSIQGVEVGLLLIEQNRGNLKLSARTRTNFDCQQLVAPFGGGGHKAAAGAILDGPVDAALAKILAEVKTRLGT
jgi:phosphoesterase RecJ-like protein